MTLPDNTARDAAILEAYQAARRPCAISRDMGLTVSTVKAVVRRARMQGLLAPLPDRHAELLAALGQMNTANMTREQLCAATGFSDSAIRTALRRLGLTFRRAPSNWAAHTRPVGGDPRAKRRAALAEIGPRAATGLKAVPADTAPHGCRYIHGEPGDVGHRYCGAERLAGRPYCDAHQALTHIPASSAAEKGALHKIDQIGVRAGGTHGAINADRTLGNAWTAGRGA